MSKGALDGIKVLDLSRVLAGPWATQMLGDMGAEVIKIERPEVGDDTRHWGPPFVINPDGSQGDAAYYTCCNRNKTSFSINIASKEGQEKVRTLAKECDVVVENFKVGQLQKYGLDYASLAAVNPALIYCSITGFGQTGPDAALPGYDFLIQAIGGLMSITGLPESNPEGEPQKVGVAIVDIVTGLYSGNAILAALYHREKTGEGQYIDMALLDCLLAIQSNQNSNYLIGDKAPTRLGNAHPNIVPYQAFKAAAGQYIIIAVGNNSQFERLCDVLGKSEWATDDRYSTNKARVIHREELVSQIAEIIHTRCSEEWLEEMERHGIPCGPVNDIAQAFSSPQVVQRKMVQNLTREDGTVIPTVANPIKFSKTPIQYKKAPPPLAKEE